MSVINLDEVGTLCLPSCLFLSPNLVLNDPFPLFSLPIFYPLDHAQYGWFFMQMSREWNSGSNWLSAAIYSRKLAHVAENWWTKENTFLGIFSHLGFSSHWWHIFDILPTLWVTKGRKKYHVFNNASTWYKIAPTVNATSPCIPGSLTEPMLAKRTIQYNNKKNTYNLQIQYKGKYNWNLGRWLSPVISSGILRTNVGKC